MKAFEIHMANGFNKKYMLYIYEARMHFIILLVLNIGGFWEAKHSIFWLEEGGTGNG